MTRRTSPLPRRWHTIRAAILDRDGHRCTWIERDIRCPETVRLEVDHIGDPDDHDPGNLRTLCSWHHARRTGKQAAAAATPYHRRRLRTQEEQRHPGVVR